MSRKVNKFTWLCFLFCYALGGLAYGQADDSRALAILDAALSPMNNEKGFSVTFQGIGYGFKDPKQILNAPLYQVHQGGYMYASGDKFEMSLGTTKGICDGKIMVITDEEYKVIFVDSVNQKGFSKEDTLGLQETINFLSKTYEDGKIAYAGEELVAGSQCHKIRADVKVKGSAVHAYYYVSKTDNKLVLMSEFAEGKYTSYWFKSFGKAPAGHKYSFNFPKEEQETFYGYKVYDLRYKSKMF